VTLSSDRHYLFVVNALSNSVSTFTFQGSNLVPASVVDSGGLTPISVAEHDGVVYVLNAGGAGNVSGFRNLDGRLQPIPNSSRGLSASGGTDPAQVGFGSDGQVLVVAEKATSRLTTYPVRQDQTLGTAVVTASSGPTPFGFAFDRRDHLIVSEATVSAASSYRFDESAPATPVLVSPSIVNGQVAACWVVVTPDGRFAYTANAGASSISSYRIDRSGRIDLSDAVAASTGNGAGVLDMAVSTGGRYLYAVAPGSLAIVSFTVDFDGSLKATGAASGLPAGNAGLAAD
jgi:6-phosphogluconolactonase (cycloisomerase 2 family)